MIYYDVYIRSFGSEYKVTYIPRFVRDDGCYSSSISYINDTVGDKFVSSIIRAKNKVIEYALCNNFEYFVTFTINGDKFPRDDLKGYFSKFSQFIRNQRRLTGAEIKYLLIPELHKDGKSWHLHGLMSGLDFPLGTFDSSLHPEKLCNKGYFRWLQYERAFGFCSLCPIDSLSAVSRYITKYITKDLGESLSRGDHLYYASRGLKTSSLVAQGCVIELPDDVFTNDWCSVKWVRDLDSIDLF